MKTRREKLSFDVAVTRANLDLFKAGVSIPLQDSPDQRKTQLEQFGFFGSSSDSNKFYPGLNVGDDVTPKDSDFVKVPFRLLSATIVGAGSWKATDFGNEAVLRASMNDLDQKPVYKDHETDIDNWVGIVDGVSWDSSKGEIPGGINGVISIDAVVAPKIARGVLQGIIFSNSVTVEFDWKPSHEFSESYEFENRIGQMHEDGTMIRRIVTDIHNYHESSLVWLGADPFAKLIGSNGELMHVDRTSVQLTKEKEQETFKNNRTYSIGFSMPKEVLGLTKKGSTSKFNNSTEMKKEQLEFLRKLLGLTEGTEITTEHLSKLALKESLSDEDKAKLASFEKIKSIDATGADAELNFASVEAVALTKESFDTLLNSIDTEKAAKVALETEKATLTEKVTELTADAAVGADFIKLKRAEVKRLYGIFVENKTEDSVLSLIESCTLDQLDGMLKQYTKGLATQFSVVVKDSETGEFEFRSSFAGEVNTNDEVSTEAVDYRSIHQKFSNNSMNVIK